MQAIAAVIFTGIAAVIGFTLYVIEAWMEPTQPLIWGLVAICPALIGLAFAVSPSLRSSEERGMGLMMVVVALSVTMGIAPGVWSLPAVRVALVDAVAEGPALKKALDDEDAGVRLSACAKMLRINTPVGEMFTVMNATPEMATACMAREKGYTEREELTRRLANQWHQVLMASPEDDVCVQADALETLEVKKSAKGAMFLSCALSSSNAKTQACCSAHLESTVGKGAMLWTRVEPNADSLFGLGVEDELLAASFDLRTNLDAEHVGALALGDDAVRRSMLERVCTELIDEEATTETVEVLDYALAERQGCLPDEVKKTTPAREMVCALMLKRLGNARDLDKLMCQAQLDAAVVTLEEYTKKLAAVNMEQRTEMSGRIQEGVKMHLDKKGDLTELMTALEERGARAAKDYTLADFRRIQDKSKAEQMKFKQWSQGGLNKGMMDAAAADMTTAFQDMEGSEENKARMEALRAKYPDYDERRANVDKTLNSFNKTIKRNGKSKR